MFYHKKCGSRVSVTIPNLMIIGYPVLGESSLKVSHVSLIKTQQTTSKIRTSFYCPVCKQIITRENAQDACRHVMFVYDFKSDDFIYKADEYQKTIDLYISMEDYSREKALQRMKEYYRESTKIYFNISYEDRTFLTEDHPIEIGIDLDA